MDRDSVRYDDSVKKDLLAAVETRKELGAGYESEIVDSFLDRVEDRLDARVEERVRRRLAEEDAAGIRERRSGRQPRQPRSDAWFAAFSLIIAIPLTAIATTGFRGGGPIGLVVVWLGIVAVNVARARSTHRG
ncbi:hypothetical protein [Phaeacidiphilus oryzae]|uniref:hypothetical protein n=1 Tax=Phaeacidiphilus oryzae TaxID=348818 RepID=UPI0005665759|nr:hypothetical protein [Phaeacidiphilus oryzae]